MAKKQRNRRSARQARSQERAERAAAQAGTTVEEVKQAQAQEAQEAAIAKQKDKEKEKKSGKPGLFARMRNYFADVASEMRRVVWPSHEELRNYSVSVVLMLVVFGVAVWLVDTGITWILVAFSNLRG